MAEHPGQVGSHTAGWAQIVLLPLQQWGCLVFPLPAAGWQVGPYILWLFFRVAKSLQSTEDVWEMTTAGTHLWGSEPPCLPGKQPACPFCPRRQV